MTEIIKGFVLSLKFSIPVFFWIGKLIWKGFFGGWLNFSKDFFAYGCSKQSEDSEGMTNKQTQKFNF